MGNHPTAVMLEFDVIDRDGEWLAGQSPLSMRDPFTQVLYPFKRPVKVRRTDWVAIQIAAGTLKACDDPLGAEAPKAAPAAKAK